MNWYEAHSYRTIVGGAHMANQAKSKHDLKQ